MTDPLTLPPSLDLASTDVQPVVRCGPRWLCEIRPGTATAQRAADFIRRRFRQAYDARPVLHLPPLLAMTTEQGTLLAVVGVRAASSHRLFLEDYLDRPIEACLPGPAADRGRVAEIAHLAGVEIGVSRPMFLALAVWLQQAGIEWVVCTGTRQLHNGFRRLGIEVSDLGIAEPGRLADGGRGWGRYYQHQPRVLAMNVPRGLPRLRAAGLLSTLTLVNAGDRTAPLAERVMGGGYGHIA